jgi:hypothetical protein
MGIATGLGIANSNSVSNTEKEKYSKLIDTQLSNSSLISSVQNLVAKTISQTLVNNTTNIQSIIDLNNSINIVAGKNCPSMSGGFVVNNVKQSLTVDSTVATTQQTTIVSNITASVNTNINNNVSNITSDTDISTNKQKIGSTLEGIGGEVVGVLTNAVGAVASVFSGSGACSGIANSCDQSKTTITETALESKYQLDNSFSLQDAVNTSDSTSSEITTENITEILQQLFASNDLLVANVCPGAINISNIQQTISVTSLMKNTVVIKLASNVASNYINKIDRVVSNMNKRAIETTTNSNKGDIAAFGDAAACIIDSGAKALTGVINATGAAGSQLIDTTGEGASNLISGTGKAAGGLFSGFVGPLLIFLVVGLAVYFFIIKKKPASKKRKSAKKAAPVEPTVPSTPPVELTVPSAPPAPPVESTVPSVEPSTPPAEDQPPDYTEKETSATSEINLGETPDVSKSEKESSDNKYYNQMGGFHGILHKISNAINKNKF